MTDAEALCRLNTASLASTRVTIVAEDLAKPRDIAEYKETYENIMVVGSGTFGSVYCARLRDSEDGEEEEAGWCEYVAAKYMILETAKVVAEAEVLRDLVQSAFIPRLVAVYGGPLHNVLVTEFLAGGDLVTRTANTEYKLNERKCQIFIRQVHLSFIINSAIYPSRNIIFCQKENCSICRLCGVCSTSTARGSSTST